MTDAGASESIQHAAELIEQADALVIGAGAGMGVDSGLPDFRGRDGFWKAYPALGAAGIAFSSIASPQAFLTDPALAWGFYGHRLALYRRTRPHDGFGILLRWAEHMSMGAAVFTSNVDGHFQQAGFSERTVHECHGSIHWLQCLRPCSNVVWRADELSPDVDEAAGRWLGPLPTCPWCGSIARPNILMFGDPDWHAQRYRDQETRLELWLARASRPVVVELGAGTAIPSVRHFSHSVIRSHGGRLVRINPGEWAVPTSADVGIAGGALATLKAIDALLGR